LSFGSKRGKNQLIFGIFERNDCFFQRLGGRTETVAYQGETFDIGAQVNFIILLSECQWIAPDHLQPRMNKLLKEFGLDTRLQYTQGKGILKFGEILTEYESEGLFCSYRSF
jgi:monoamine oxidase